MSLTIYKLAYYIMLDQVKELAQTGVQLATSDTARSVLLAVCLVLLIVLVSREAFQGGHGKDTSGATQRHNAMRNDTGFPDRYSNLPPQSSYAGRYDDASVMDNEMFKATGMAVAHTWPPTKGLYRQQNDWAQDAIGHTENVGRDKAGWADEQQDQVLVSDDTLAETLMVQ